MQPLRPSLDRLACLNPECKDCDQPARGNLVVRKTYGRDQIRLLRCRTCGDEFSERKNTPLWNSRIPEAQFVSTAEHLTDGNTIKGTARLLRLHHTTVRRIALRSGTHVRALHDERARNLNITALQADERHGFAGTKDGQLWDATVIEPRTKFLVHVEVGPRDVDLGRRLLLGARQRLRNPFDLLLFTDGWAVYEQLFSELFGQTYRPKRKGDRGRFPKPRVRIPLTLAHVLIVKRREGRRVVEVVERLAHGTWKRVDQEVEKLGYQRANTSAIERQNATARKMNVHNSRKSLAFARTPRMRRAMSNLAMGAYNWTRPQRALRLKLDEPRGRQVYAPRTPAMAIGLTDRVWSMADLLRCPRRLGP